MPAISRIRFTNVIYEGGLKRYNDELFELEGENTAMILENGGGKTVFVQTAIQAMLPHSHLSNRRIRETLSLEGSPCHVAIEWILSEKPRRYLLTAVTLFLSSDRLDSYKYVYEYGEGDQNAIGEVPFSIQGLEGQRRPSGKEEILSYYREMKSKSMNAKLFTGIGDYHAYIEENYKLIPSEWKSIVEINGEEGGIEGYFENCKTTSQLVNNLLIPTVEGSVDKGNSEDFADEFEGQLKRFKSHKKLSSLIEESKRVLEKIDIYMEIFKEHEDANMSLNREKAYAKSVYNYLLEESKKIEGELGSREKESEEIAGEFKELERKRLSYNLIIMEEELERQRLNLEDIEGKYTDLKENIDFKRARIQNIELARLRESIREKGDRIKTARIQISNIEEETDIEGIRQQLDLVNANIRGYYCQREGELRAGILKIEESLSGLKGALEQDRQGLDKSIGKLKGIESERDKSRGNLDEIEKDLQRILNTIPMESSAMDMVELQSTYVESIASTEQSLVDYRNALSQLEGERKIVSQSLKHDREEKSKNDLECYKLSQRLGEIDRENKKLMESLKEIDGSWNSYASIYSMEHRVLESLAGKLKLLDDEMNRFDLRERIVERYSKDYGSQSTFVAEPLLHDLVDKWKADVEGLELGYAYLERRLGDDRNKSLGVIEGYPYWSTSLITETSQVEKLKKKLRDSSEMINYPIFVLDQVEAEALASKGDLNLAERAVVPDHWAKSLDAVEFEVWKKQVNTDFADISREKSLRKAKKQAIQNFIGELKEFMGAYPYEEKKELEGKLEDLKLQSRRLEEALLRAEERLSDIEREMNFLYQSESNDKDKLEQMNKLISSIADYISKKRRYDEIKSRVCKLETESASYRAELVKLKAKISKLDRMIGQLEGQGRDLELEQKHLKREELYGEVLEFEPIYTDVSIEGLKSRRTSLMDAIYIEQGDIRRYELEISENSSKKRELERELESRIQSSEYEIDESLVYGEHEQEQANKYLYEVKLEARELAELEESLEKVRNTFNKKESEIEVKRESFSERFELLESFEEPIAKVKNRLDELESKLKEQGDRNRDLIHKLQSERESSLKLIHVMEIQDGRYGFLEKSIETVRLDEQFEMDFPYQRQSKIDAIRDRLDKLTTKSREKKERLDTYRYEFKAFCDRGIRDSKLREMTVLDIDRKDDYEKVVDWYTNINRAIKRSLDMAERDLREHDRDLENFIGYLYRYADKVALEIASIPKKTRFKVDGKWKDIFIFNLPEYQEIEAKEEIRKHIDSLLKEVESIESRDLDKADQGGQIRREIERWLDIKQILPVMMKNRPIKISCRKVSSENKVSSSISSWEGSNKWSGGEKWSKNMTLFLGLLNYIAEKKQGILEGALANRVVILDNPFGKASSDHVLAPVFYIAEKLKFQIIALTAHQEGDFIADHFPVVYSLKLRQATDDRSRIVEKKKEIGQAVLHDKSHGLD